MENGMELVGRESCFFFSRPPCLFASAQKDEGVCSNRAALHANPGFYFGRAIVCSRPPSRHRVRRKITDAHTTVRGSG